MIDQPVGTVVIGGSQAGLAAGYYLKQHDLPFVILDENERIGDAWRKRWGMTGVRNGYPVLANGRVLEVSNVIWCTGYAPNYDWIDFSLPKHNGVSHS